MHHNPNEFLWLMISFMSISRLKETHTITDGDLFKKKSDHEMEYELHPVERRFCSSNDHRRIRTACVGSYVEQCAGTPGYWIASNVVSELNDNTDVTATITVNGLIFTPSQILICHFYTNILSGNMNKKYI